VAVCALLRRGERHDDNPPRHHRPIVQDLLWTEGYGAVSGMLSFPSNVAKGIAPIAAATIWTSTHGYTAVEWTVFLVSIMSAIAFIVAVRLSRYTATGVA
jgi:hypothetical protein